MKMVGPSYLNEQGFIAGPSSISLVTSAAPSAPRIQGTLSSDDDDDDEEEEEGEVAYRLLELPDEICKMIEEAQVKAKERAKQKQDEEGQEQKQDRSRKRRRQGKNIVEQTEEREHLIINGRHGDEAVLCTADKTYALREISQSNSLLLCSLDVDQVDTSRHKALTDQVRPASRLSLKSNVSQLLELVPVVPRLERIVEVLRGSLYEGEMEEKRKKGQKRYTPQQVRSIVQASDAEVQRGYDEHHVVLLDGEMRLISPSYLHSLLLSLLLILDANAYLPGDVPLSDAIRALCEDHDMRKEVAEATLCRWFGQEKKDVTNDNRGTGRVALDGVKVARFLGEELLKEAKEPMLLTTMMNKWTSQAGDAFGVHVDLELLRSLYLLHPAQSHPSSTTATPRQIQHFPRSALPSAPAPRFQALFATRTHWTLEELNPFLEDLAVDAKRREALLLRFARAKKVQIHTNAGAEGRGGKTDKGRKTSGGHGAKDRPPPLQDLTLYSARVRY